MSESTIRLPFNDLKTFEGRCKHLYKIKTKNGSIEPFLFLEAQRYFNDIVEEEFVRTKNELGYSSCKIMAVKPRQVGWTTYSNIKSLDMQIQDMGSDGVIAAHDKDTTKLVYRIYQRAYKELPNYVIPLDDNGKEMTVREFFKKKLRKDDYDEFVRNLMTEYGEAGANEQLDLPHRIKYKPETKTHSGNQIEFIDTDSITNIFTAGKGDDGGKGGTLKRVHFTECANYSGYDALNSSINPSVPKKANGIFYIKESTANGTTGDGEGFYKEWQNSVEAWQRYIKGEDMIFSGFRPVFIPWYTIEEYELPLAGGKIESLKGIKFNSPEEKRNFLEREEKMRTEGIFNPLTQQVTVVSEEKLNWYRNIIKTDCNYEYRDAQRYYPTTPEDAFVASANSFFDSLLLNERKAELLASEQSYEVGEIEWDEATDNLIFKIQTLGNLRIFEYPDTTYSNRYVVGVDIGRGYDDGDYSCAYVFDRLEQKYVAIWHGKIDQDQFADIIMEIGIYYNEALIVPESNLDTVINIINPDGSRPYIGEVYFDQSKNGQQRYGYLTHKASRQILIDHQKAWLRENANKYKVLPDIETVDEYLAFVRKRTSHGVRYEADEGHHDDRPIASALAKFGDDWWEESVQEYKPNKLIEIITRPQKRKKDFVKFSKLGRSKGVT